MALVRAVVLVSVLPSSTGEMVTDIVEDQLVPVLEGAAGEVGMVQSVQWSVVPDDQVADAIAPADQAEDEIEIEDGPEDEPVATVPDLLAQALNVMGAG